MISTAGFAPKNEYRPTSFPFSTDSNKKLAAVRSSWATRRLYASTGVRWSPIIRRTTGITVAFFATSSNAAFDIRKVYQGTIALGLGPILDFVHRMMSRGR